jgi:hypothetical protein
MMQLSPLQVDALRQSIPAKVFLDVDDNYVRFLLVDRYGNILVGRVAILKDASINSQIDLIDAEWVGR